MGYCKCYIRSEFTKEKNDYQKCAGFKKKCEVVHDFWAFFVQTSHWKYMSNLTCSLFISRMWILLQLHLQISFRRTEPTGFFLGKCHHFSSEKTAKNQV